MYLCPLGDFTRNFATVVVRGLIGGVNNEKNY